MIRLGRPEDLPAIRELVQRAYEHYIARIGRKPGPLLDDYPALVSRNASTFSAKTASRASLF